MSDCLFCKIVSGQVPSAKIYEDDDIFAFLDINPCRPGHALVVPKLHVATLFDLPLDRASTLMAALQRLGKAVMEATDATGLNVCQNNFEDAGQTVFHVHWHLIPRHKDDGVKLWPQGSYPDVASMQAMTERIVSRLR